MTLVQLANHLYALIVLVFMKLGMHNESSEKEECVCGNKDKEGREGRNVFLPSHSTRALYCTP